MSNENGKKCNSFNKANGIFIGSTFLNTNKCISGLEIRRLDKLKTKSIIPVLVNAGEDHFVMLSHKEKQK